MHPKGTSFREPTVQFFVRLDLDRIFLFLDELKIQHKIPNRNLSDEFTIVDRMFWKTDTTSHSAK